MAINKSSSPAWVKVTLIILIIAFVASITGMGLLSFLGAAGQGDTTTSTTTPASTVDAQHQATVASLTAALQSEPTSYTVLVQLGNTYFDWAAAKQQEMGSASTQGGADLPLWTSAKDAYARALAVDDTESPVAVDYAITLFYTGDTLKAIEWAEKVIERDPAFAPAHFNSGIFYQALGQNDKAIIAFKKYLELDPEGTAGGSPDFAKQQLTALEGSATP